MKTKLTQNIAHFLESPKGYKKSWIRSFMVILLAIAIIGVVLGLSFSYGPLATGSTSNTTIEFSKNLFLPSNLSFLQNASYLCYVSLGLVLVPFICLFTFWIIGINQTTKSPFFHIFMWFCVAIGLILVIVALVLFIRCAVTNYDIY